MMKTRKQSSISFYSILSFSLGFVLFSSLLIFIPRDKYLVQDSCLLFIENKTDLDTSKELTSRLVVNFPDIQLLKIKRPPPPKGININPVFILENGFYFETYLEEIRYKFMVWIEDEKVYANLHRQMGCHSHHRYDRKSIDFEKFELLYTMNLQKQEMHFNIHLDAIDFEHDSRIMANGQFVLNMTHPFQNSSKNKFLRYGL